MNQSETTAEPAIQSVTHTPSDDTQQPDLDDFEDVNETMDGNDDFADVMEAFEKEMKAEPTDLPPITPQATPPPSPTTTSSPLPTPPYSALPPTPLPPPPPPTSLSLTKLCSSMVEEVDASMDLDVTEEEDTSMDSIFEDVTEDVVADNDNDFQDSFRALEEEDDHANETISKETVHTNKCNSPEVGIDTEEVEFEDVNDDVEAGPGDNFQETIKALEEEDNIVRGAEGKESTEESTDGDVEDMKEKSLEETNFTEKTKTSNVNIVVKKTKNNEVKETKISEDDEYEDAVYQGMCINVSQPLDLEFHSEDLTSYNETETQTCDSETEKDIAFNGSKMETELKKIERATRKCRQVKTIVEATKPSGKQSRRTWKMELEHLEKSVMEESNPIETFTNKKHVFMSALQLKPSNSENIDIPQKTCNATKEGNMTKIKSKTKKVPKRENAKVSSKRKEADTKLETSSLIISPMKRLKTNISKSKREQEVDTLVEEDDVSQLEGCNDDNEIVDAKLTISLDEKPIEDDLISLQEDLAVDTFDTKLTINVNEFEEQFKKEAKHIKKVKVEEKIVELPDIMTIEEIDLVEFDTELSPLHQPKETKKPTNICKCNYEEVFISKKEKKSGNLKRELRCEAFKCGKYFHCKAAVKWHFSQQHSSWDDL